MGGEDLQIDILNSTQELFHWQIKIVRFYLNGQQFLQNMNATV